MAAAASAAAPKRDKGHERQGQGAAPSSSSSAFRNDASLASIHRRVLSELAERDVCLGRPSLFRRAQDLRGDDPCRERQAPPASASLSSVRSEEDQTQGATALQLQQQQQQQHRRLILLKRKRIALCAELEERRTVRRRSSLSDDLAAQRRLRLRLRDRPYLIRGGGARRGGGGGTVFLSFRSRQAQHPGAAIADGALQDEGGGGRASPPLLTTTAIPSPLPGDRTYTTCEAFDLGGTPAISQLRRIRFSRMLAAAYRLAGISVSCPSRDNEHANHNHGDPEEAQPQEIEEEQEEAQLLALHLDVCVHGTFLEQHHVVLELVSASTAASDRSDDGDRSGDDLLYLRLKHHTLPPSLSDELHRRLGTESAPAVCLGRLAECRAAASGVAGGGAPPALQRSVRALHRACAAHATRLQALHHLKLLRTPRHLSLDLLRAAEARGIQPSLSPLSADATTVYFVDRVVLTDSRLSFRVHVAHVELPLEANLAAPAAATAGGEDENDGEEGGAYQPPEAAVASTTPLGPNSVAVRVVFDVAWPCLQVRPSGGVARVRGTRHEARPISLLLPPQVLAIPDGGGNNNVPSRAAATIEDEDSDDGDGGRKSLQKPSSMRRHPGGGDDALALGTLAADLLGRMPARPAVERLVAHVVASSSRS